MLSKLSNNIPKYGSVTASNSVPLKIASFAASHIKDGMQLTTREAIGYAVTFMMLYENAGTAYMLLLDKFRRIIKSIRLKSGHGKARTDISAAVEREVENTSASYFVIVHNHKNSPLIPSHEDQLLTEMLYRKYSGEKVRFLEHYIVSGFSYITLTDGKNKNFCE